MKLRSMQSTVRMQPVLTRLPQNLNFLQVKQRILCQEAGIFKALWKMKKMFV